MQIFRWMSKPTLRYRIQNEAIRKDFGVVKNLGKDERKSFKIIWACART